MLWVLLLQRTRHIETEQRMQVIAGYCTILMVATVNTLLQHLSADEMRGRVMSIYTMAFLGAAPIGSLIAGSLAHAVSAERAIGAMCTLALAGTLGLYAFRRELRDLD